MSNHIVETVTFQLQAGVSESDFLASAEQATQFMKACPGFLRRRLSREENGNWIEHVEWASMADAEAAAAQIGNSEHTRAFMGAIDGSSVKMAHSHLKASFG
jgi:antibiotic biosynthesis monooxygenase (ABM) superfamily enzyme